MKKRNIGKATSAEMEDDGLVRYASTSYSTGYVITSKGRVAAAELQSPTKGRG